MPMFNSYELGFNQISTCHPVCYFSWIEQQEGEFGKIGKLNVYCFSIILNGKFQLVTLFLSTFFNIFFLYLTILL